MQRPAPVSPLGIQTREAWSVSPSGEPLRAVNTPYPPFMPHTRHTLHTQYHKCPHDIDCIPSTRTFSHLCTGIQKNVHAVTTLRNIFTFTQDLSHSMLTVTRIGIHSCTPRHNARARPSALPVWNGQKGVVKLEVKSFGPETWASSRDPRPGRCPEFSRGASVLSPCCACAPQPQGGLADQARARGEDWTEGLTHCGTRHMPTTWTEGLTHYGTRHMPTTVLRGVGEPPSCGRGGWKWDG